MWKIIFLNVKMCPRSLAKTWTLYNWKISESFWEKIILCWKRGVLPRVTLHSNTWFECRVTSIVNTPFTIEAFPSISWLQLFELLNKLFIFAQRTELKILNGLWTRWMPAALISKKSWPSSLGIINIYICRSPKL